MPCNNPDHDHDHDQVLPGEHVATITMLVHVHDGDPITALLVEMDESASPPPWKLALMMAQAATVLAREAAVDEAATTLVTEAEAAVREAAERED